VSSADMSVVKVWVMSVTSNRILIEELTKLWDRSEPCQGNKSRLAEVGGQPWLADVARRRPWPGEREAEVGSPARRSFCSPGRRRRRRTGIEPARDRVGLSPVLKTGGGPPSTRGFSPDFVPCVTSVS